MGFRVTVETDVMAFFMRDYLYLIEAGRDGTLCFQTVYAASCLMLLQPHLPA